MTAVLLGNLALLVSDLLAARLLRRGGAWAALAVVPGPVVVLGAASLVSSGSMGSFFYAAQLLCWWGLLHLPLVVLLAGRRRAPGLALAVVSAGIAAYAFAYEPHALETTEVLLAGPDLRIALLADLQTDDVGAYEADVFARVRAWNPDLVLFAGDYIQERDPDARARERAELHDLVATLHPRLGGYAVGGDVDDAGWPSIFAGTAITAVPATRTFPVGPVTLTALSLKDSRALDLPRLDPPTLHVVLGHAPDFVLGSGRGHVNLAGHTHGGQVRVPGFGPLLTLTGVPRDWASGYTKLPDGNDLYVSRGIGLERGYAPPVRFACPPELVLIELRPPKDPEDDRPSASR